jgi:hypothetical protein
VWLTGSVTDFAYVFPITTGLERDITNRTSYSPILALKALLMIEARARPVPYGAPHGDQIGSPLEAFNDKRRLTTSVLVAVWNSEVPSRRSQPSILTDPEFAFYVYDPSRARAKTDHGRILGPTKYYQRVVLSEARTYKV